MWTIPTCVICIYMAFGERQWYITSALSTIANYAGLQVGFAKEIMLFILRLTFSLAEGSIWTNKVFLAGTFSYNCIFSHQFLSLQPTAVLSFNSIDIKIKVKNKYVRYRYLDICVTCFYGDVILFRSISKHADKAKIYEILSRTYNN